MFKQTIEYKLFKLIPPTIIGDTGKWEYVQKIFLPAAPLAMPNTLTTLVVNNLKYSPQNIEYDTDTGENIIFALLIGDRESAKFTMRIQKAQPQPQPLKKI